jgi:serine/threonine-protein kinase
MAADPLFDDVAGAVLDGDPVNWADVEAGADATATSVVKHLRVLSLVADLHRPQGSAATRQQRSRGMPTESWGHLRLLERVGRGAFGEVYRAWDARLDREVALKLLPAPKISDAAASSIIEEGRLLARVRHPGVVTIHGAEQIGDRVGLWMEYVRGSTLEELLEDGERFTPAEVIRIGIELCSAVAAVHAAGVIHRDIKAQNVIHADDGRVMLMDFGAGLETAAAASAPAGTPFYLAPELLAGAPASQRSDVYSLGVLLYHLLTGRFPVAGKSLHDVRIAHERGERALLAAARPDLPRRLARAIEHAIDPQPARRCQSATALAAALQSAQRGSKKRWFIGLAAAAAVFMLWTSQIARDDTGANRSLADIARGPAVSWWDRLWPVKPKTVTVLPFRNLGTVAGSDLMAEGLTAEVRYILGSVEGLNVWPAGSDVPADVMIEGDLLASEDRVKVNARTTSPTGAVDPWNGTFETRNNAVLDIQTTLARDVVNSLRLRLGAGQRHYEIAPLLQRKYWHARGLVEKHEPRFSAEAAALFQEIIDEVPSYAPAHAGLASALGSIMRLGPDLVPDLLQRMKRAADEAYRLDPLLAETSAVLGVVYAHELEWALSEDSFKEALSRNRSLTWIHTDAVLHLLSPLGRFNDALQLLEVAREADPKSLDVLRTLASILVEVGQYEEAKQNARMVLKEDPTYPFAANRLGRALALSGRHDDALRVFEEDPRVGPAYVGYVYAVTGRRDEAEAIARNVANGPADWAAATQLLVYGGLGDKERAFEALNLLVERNPWRAATWMLRPELEFLRDDRRFGEIRRRLKIPPN